MTLPERPVRPTPRGRPKADDQTAIEARLIAVARETFFSLGYGAATMDAVAAAARASKATLYSRFPSKRELFRAVVHDQVSKWRPGADKPPSEMGDTLEATLRLRAEMWLRASMMSEFINLSRLMFSELARFPELLEATQMPSKRGADSIIQVITHFAERDGVPCKDPDAAAELFQIMMGGWVYQCVMRNAPYDQAVAKAWIDYAVGCFVAGRSVW